MSTKKLTDLFFLVGGNNTAEWMSPSPDELEYVNQHGLSRKHIFDSVKKSLERLQFDYIEVLQCINTTLIVGTTSLQNLADLLGAVHVKSTEDEVRQLEEAYKPLPVTGHS